MQHQRYAHATGHTAGLLGGRLHFPAPMVSFFVHKAMRRGHSAIGRYLRKVGAQRPSFSATGKPCPWPDEVKLSIIGK